MKSRICTAINPAGYGNPSSVRCRPVTCNSLTPINPLLVKPARSRLLYWLRGASLCVILGWMMVSLMLIAERKEQRRVHADEVGKSHVVAARSPLDNPDSSAWINIANK